MDLISPRKLADRARSRSPLPEVEPSRVDRPFASHRRAHNIACTSAQRRAQTAFTGLTTVREAEIAQQFGYAIRVSTQQCYCLFFRSIHFIGSTTYRSQATEFTREISSAPLLLCLNRGWAVQGIEATDLLAPASGEHAAGEGATQRSRGHARCREIQPVLRLLSGLCFGFACASTRQCC